MVTINIVRRSKYFRKLGIWPWLAINISLGFLIFFATFLSISFRAMDDSSKRLLDQQLVITQMASNQVDNYMTHAFRDLGKMATYVQVDPQAKDSNEKYNLLAPKIGIPSTFSLGVYLYDAKGNLVMTEPYDASIIGADYSAKSYILSVMETGQRSVSPPFVEPDTGIRVIAMTIPIKNEMGEVIYMLSGLVDISDPAFVSPIEEALNLGRTGHGELFDSQGTVLVSTIAGAFSKPGEHIEFYRRMLAEGLKKVEIVPDDDNGEKGDHVMAFVPLSTVNWGVALGGDATETFAPITILRNSLFISGGVMLVVILMATLIGTRYLLRPIKTLTLNASEIAHGNMSASVEVEGLGEIGVLGKSLDAMRLKLKDSFEEIKGWNLELEERVRKRTEELKQTLEEINELKNMRELDRIRAEFVSSVSHELRTPLGLITGYATTLLRPDVAHSEETRKEFLQIIREEGEKLAELVDNILDNSRIQAGKFDMDKTPTNVTELVQRTVAKVRSVTKGHSFLTHLKPSPSISADSRRLEQVMFNLLDNAVKYTPQGGEITVSVEVEAGHIKISVADRGPGIPRAELTKIFDPFYRVAAGDSRKAPGVGLGLGICRAIVEAHGGIIWAESNPGQGSIFSFILPLQEEI